MLSEERNMKIKSKKFRYKYLSWHLSNVLQSTGNLPVTSQKGLGL